MSTTKSLKLSDSRIGAWIINICKHLVLNYSPTNPALCFLDDILFAGRCGNLLIKLSADETEQLERPKVYAHARLCGIGPQELQVYLNTLKSFGCLDWDKEGTIFEVLASSRKRVLETTSKIFSNLSPKTSPLPLIETELIGLLEFCLTRPRLEDEIKEYLSTKLSEEEINYLLKLVYNFGLLGVTPIPGKQERLFFNEYQFGENASDIGKGLAALSKNLKEELNYLLERVANQPGIMLETVNVSEDVKQFAVGLGLVEVSEVLSPAGNGKFLTLPRFSLPTVGQETEQLENDVFHHAKMLLSSLRFGQFRSKPSRGKILSPGILVERLLEKERIGPCTAIGEDYVILEGEGVIRTIPASHLPGNQFYMELRRREPAEIVLGLLKSGTSELINANSLPRSIELPVCYLGPESLRLTTIGKVVNHSPEIINKFLEALRT